MSKYVIDGSTLTSIGNAIREKTGGTESIPVTDLATSISAIESGGLKGLLEEAQIMDFLLLI